MTERRELPLLGPRGSLRGMALFVVLAVLTILSIFAVAFVALSNLEITTSQVTSHGMQSDALARSGIEHAKCLLWYDARHDRPGADAPSDIWSSAFQAPLPGVRPDADADLIPNNGPNGDGNDAAWLAVRDAAGALIGRYAVAVQDEASKININTACLIPPLKPNQGLSPRELLLGDGGARGIPVGRDALIRLLKERFGPNRVPGARGDDNGNNSFLMADGLDNNANGVIDELDEGIDEYDEYVPSQPFGDDRAFSSMAEAWMAMAPGVPPSAQRLALTRQHATIASRDVNRRWDAAAAAWRPRCNLNIAPARDVYSALKDANDQQHFENESRNLRCIAANLADYRDENAVLTTISSEYGVEAVCFNEILANEGSKIRRPYDVQNYLTGDRADTRVHCLAYLYGTVDYREPTQYGHTMDLQSTNVAMRELFFRNGEVAFRILTNRTQLVGQTIRVVLRDYPEVAEGYYNAFTDFRSLLQSRGGGYTSGVRINWPENIWANCYMAVFDKRPATNADRFPRKVFSIRRSTTDNVLYLDAKGVSAEDLEKLKNGGYLYAQLRGWVWDKALYAELPSVSTWLVCQGLDPQKYYRVFIHETNLETPTDDKVGGHQYSKYLDVDGTLARSSRQECRRLRYRYDDGTAKRPDQRGCMDIYLTSTSECQPLARNRVNAIYFARPDIIELINISDRPISIRNWSLVANTGSLAYELGAIDKAIGYSREFGGRTADPNPVIRPGEYFYLCNNAEIFDFEHGSPRNGSWGSSLNEAMPLYEIDDDTWGVRFQIRSVSESRGANNQWISRVTCGNESWKRDQFLNEVAEFQTTRASTSRSVSPDGVRYQINGGNTRNTLIFDTFKLKEYSDIQPGDYVMIVGMPRVGGFLSLTLKNEYGQIASRVLEYGNPGADATRNPDRWIGWSAEKLDPTHESWTLTSKPTIGGSVARARNHTLPSGKYAAPHVKNGPFASIGEIQQVRTGKDWENVGGGKAGSTTILRGTADYFDTAALRLDASAEGAHVAGWHPAFGECSQSDRRNLVDNAANWENAIWNNQSLAILSGDCRGEVFPVVSSGRSSLHVVGRSVPRRIEFSVRKGDRYAVGPGYSSAMYYTRREGDEGEWEWSRQRIPKGSYELFLSGLNDSIITTEFLEENRNAKLDVFLYNYSTRMYDQIGSGRQYDKSDVCVAGTVSPEHISGGGALRLKLVARGLQGERSGFAWFNCAFLTPVPVEGRININTAPPRILMCLNGVDQSLAANIFRGIDSQGRAILKPYQSIADLLRVRGMSPAIFGPIVNLVTIRSDQYTVHAVGQRVLDRDRDGEFSSDAGDKVLATTRLRVLFDRTPVIEQPNGENGAAIRILERERL